MRYWTFYRLALKARKRANEDFDFVYPIIVLLSFLFSLFLSLFISFLDYRVSFILYLCIFYLLMEYNANLICKEFGMKNRNTFKTKNRFALRLLAYLILENNPYFLISFLFLGTNLIVNLNSLFKVFISFNAFLLMALYFLIFIQNEIKRKIIMGIVLKLILVLMLIVPSSLPFISPILIILLMIISKQAVHTSIVEKSGSDNLIRKIGHNFFPSSLALRYIFYHVRKISVNCFLFLSLGFLADKLIPVPVIGVSSFMLLLDLELNIDEKFKYFYKFRDKYYFIKTSHLSFFRRYRVSEVYAKTLESSLYLFAFGFGSRTGIIYLISYLVFIQFLGILYYFLEEKMFELERKMNTLLTQYLIFLTLIGFNMLVLGMV